MNTLAFLAALMFSAAPVQRPAGCEGLAGRWTWFTGITVTFQESGLLEGALVFGRCEQVDAARRTYRIQWQNGFIDTLTLSSDGNSLDGANAQSDRVFADRMGAAGSTSSRTARCEALAGRWNASAGPPVVVREDGTLDNGILSGRCELNDARLRRYTLRWETGGSDVLVLSEDKNRLDGFSNLGVAVSATRIASPSLFDAGVTGVDKPPDLVPIPERASSVAVVIGLSTYREPEIPKLPYARNDADVLSKYLENTAGIRKENMRVVSDDRATLSDIADAIENWLPRHVTQDSTVFVYYAGHGALDPATGETYLVPYEGTPESPSTRLYPLRRLYEKLEGLPAKEVIVFLDSCFSGGGRSIAMRGRPLVIVGGGPSMSFRKVTVLAAAQGNQISSDLDSVKHGLFTYFLLTGIRGEADTSKDGWVDLKELRDFVREKVRSTAISQLNRDQTPALLGPVNVEALAGQMKLFRSKK